MILAPCSSRRSRHSFGELTRSVRYDAAVASGGYGTNETYGTYGPPTSFVGFSNPAQNMKLEAVPTFVQDADGNWILK